MSLILSSPSGKQCAHGLVPKMTKQYLAINRPSQHDRVKKWGDPSAAVVKACRKAMEKLRLSTISEGYM